MKLSRDTKLEILSINLDALKSEDLQDAIIVVDEETVAMWLNHLADLERYEDCNLIKQNILKLTLDGVEACEDVLSCTV